MVKGKKAHFYLNELCHTIGFLSHAVGAPITAARRFASSSSRRPISGEPCPSRAASVSGPRVLRVRVHGSAADCVTDPASAAALDGPHAASLFEDPVGGHYRDRSREMAPRSGTRSARSTRLERTPTSLINHGYRRAAIAPSAAMCSWSDPARKA